MAGKIMVNTKWDDSMWLKVYELARQGMSDRKIAQVLNVTHKRLKLWYGQKPALKEGVDSLRPMLTDKTGKSESFQEYVYRMLPTRLKRKWDKLNKWAEEDSGCEKIERMLSKGGKGMRQHLFLHALTTGNFNVSEACRKVNISKQTFDQWCAFDPDFQEMIDEIHWHKKNLFEGHLVKLVEAGDSSATIFVNRTINRDRGYSEKNVSEVNVNVNGTIKHEAVPLSRLSMEARKEILEKKRQMQLEKERRLQITHNPEEVVDVEYE